MAKKLNYPDATVKYLTPEQEWASIKASELEGKQLPNGSIVTQTVRSYPYDLNNVGDPKDGISFKRMIRYKDNTIPNDTIYMHTNPEDFYRQDPKKGFDKVFYKDRENEKTLVDDIIEYNTLQRNKAQRINNHSQIQLDIFKQRKSVGQPRFKKNESFTKPVLYQQGGQVDNQLKPIVDAALEMANIFKTTGYLVGFPYNSYYEQNNEKIPVKVNTFEVTPNDTIIGVTSLTNKLPYTYTKLSGNDSKVIKMTKDPNDITKQVPSYEEGSEKDYYINLSRQVFKNKNKDKWYNKLEDFMRSIAHPEVDKLKLNKYQQGGALDANQLGQLAKAAFQMANEFKKQGAITEIAGEQAIAQAFQQTPEAAKMFVAAAQKQDAETILKLFTQLGIVK